MSKRRHWVFTLLTDDPRLAYAADEAGIDRIGPDLEIVGKEERQKGLKTRISRHRLEDAAPVFACVRRQARFTRVNPVNPGTPDEVDALVAAGADVLMLPYFKRIAEVERFSEVVAGRALTVGLAETPACLAFVDDIIRRGLLDELHFGLNDLGIAMGKTHPEVLRDRRFLAASAIVRRSGMPFGIAGVARPHDVGLPYHPGKFATQIADLGANRTLISRSFLGPSGSFATLAEDIAELRAFLADVEMAPAQ